MLTTANSIAYSDAPMPYMVRLKTKRRSPTAAVASVGRMEFAAMATFCGPENISKIVPIVVIGRWLQTLNQTRLYVPD
jgi:hypothetical protein